MAVHRLRRGGFVSRAARLVPAGDVLTWLGIPNPGTPGEGVSVKVFCPFSETHPPDRSGEKDMRLYSDQRAFCHMCAQGYDSVGLAAQAWGLTRPEAARAVLSRAGLDVSGVEELDEALAKPRPEALRTGAVAALAYWADTRGVSRFSAQYVQCLGLADQIIEPDHVDLWITACKKYLETFNAKN
jgi:hypothetical protein